VGFDGFGDGLKLADCEPTDWFVAFHPDSPTWWVRWLACGRFKHVSVMGFVPRAQTWAFFDFQMDRSRIYLIGNHEADAALGHFAAGNTIVRMARPIGQELNLNMSVGLWCVPAAAHILGLKSCALRPDALFRQCLANGGEIIDESGGHEAAAAKGRSGARPPEGSGGSGENQHDARAADD
jgi:hypothetical protein